MSETMTTADRARIDRYMYVNAQLNNRGDETLVVVYFPGIGGGGKKNIGNRYPFGETKGLRVITLMEFDFEYPKIPNVTVCPTEVNISAEAEVESKIRQAFNESADFICQFYQEYGERVIFFGISKGADVLVGGLREFRRRVNEINAAERRASKRTRVDVPKLPVLLFSGGAYGYVLKDDELNGVEGQRAEGPLACQCAIYIGDKDRTYRKSTQLWKQAADCKWTCLWEKMGKDFETEILWMEGETHGIETEVHKEALMNFCRSYLTDTATEFLAAAEMLCACLVNICENV